MGSDGWPQAAAQKKQQSQKDEEDGRVESFGEVLPDPTRTDKGATHRVKNELYVEIPDSLMGRGLLMGAQGATAQADLGGGGEKADTQVLRWQRRGDELLLRGGQLRENGRFRRFRLSGGAERQH
jgi:hypothetical protein